MRGKFANWGEEISQDGEDEDEQQLQLLLTGKAVRCFGTKPFFFLVLSETSEALFSLKIFCKISRFSITSNGQSIKYR